LLAAVWVPSLGVATVATRADDSATVGAATVDDRGVLLHRVRSTYQRDVTEIRVLLPTNCRGRQPVLYVLPVEAGTESRYGDGVAEVLKHDIHDRYGLICVFPTFTALPWYADHPSDKHIRQESYFLKVVVPFIEREYPTRAVPDARLLVGFSKSGWGALSLLLRQPDTFGKTAAWDAPLMMNELGKFGTRPIFGTPENFQKYQITRLLENRAHNFRSGERLILLGYATFGRDHDELHTLMTALGVSHVYREGELRPHTWHSGWLPEAVELLVQPGKAAHSTR
jgi:S-formylglutathione hydrolase FrmB